VFDDEFLRRIFGLKMRQTGGWRKLHKGSISKICTLCQELLRKSSEDECNGQDM
jgi:hypothetical protein